MTQRTMVAKERLMDLERMIDALNGELRNMQWELRQTKSGSLTERFWRNLMGPMQTNDFMSAVCNRHVRPNTKVVSHDGARA